MNRHFSLITRLIAAVAAIVIPLAMNSENSPSTAPDFAYPEKVIANAETQLNDALKAADGQSVVNALIKYGLAKTSISNDNYADVIKKVETVIDKETQPAVRSLLQMLLADLYNSYYSANRHNFDERTTLAAEKDFTLWSGAQFKDKIRGLYLAALSPREELLAAKTADYPEIITSGDYTYTFYPTLFDFASNKAINALNALSSRQGVFPLNALFNKVALPQILTPTNRSIVEIADNWVAAHSAESAPYIQALIARSEYLSRCLANKSNSNAYITPAIKAYRDHVSNPYAIELILDTASSMISGKNATEVYGILSKFITDHPDYIRIDAVKAAQAILSQENVLADVPAVVAKDRPAELNVKLINAPEATVHIYRMKSGITKTENFKITDFETTPCFSTTVKSDKSIPFSDNIKAEFTLSRYGIYRLALDGEKPDRNNVNIFRCTDIAMISNDVNTDAAVWAVNPATGKPLPGVKVKFEQRDFDITVLKTETTDSDGAVTPPRSPSSYYISASKGDDKYALSMWEYLSESRDETNKAAYINTDLPIYHPGDTVNIVAIFYSYNAKSKSPLKKLSAELIIKNANNQALDTISIVTDEYGRASASFHIPTDGLTGNYRISAKASDKYLATERFMVSDYKLPTFEITLDTPQIEGSDVIVKGKAMGYNGFPIQNASVKVALAGMSRSSWFLPQSVEFYTDTIATDQSGQFAIRVTPEIAATTPFPGGTIKADVTATSASGESHEASTTFSIGKSYYIEASEGLLRAVADAKLHYGLFNFVNKSVDGTLMLKFTRGGESREITATTKAGTASATADLSGLHSGVYQVEISAPGTDAETVTLSKVSVYNSADSNSPSDSHLWILDNHITINAASKRKAEIVYAVSQPDAYVQMTMYTSDKVLSRKWLRPKQGVNKLTVEIPAGVETANVLLTTVCDYQSYTEDIDIEVKNPANTLNVEIERMRDRVSPLSEETVTVKVTDGSGKGVQSALILDMYSKALNSLQSHSWHFFPRSGYSASLSFSSYNPMTTSVSSDWSWFANRGNKYKSNPIFVPSFNLYGHTFGSKMSMDRIMIRGTYNSAAPMMSKMESNDMVLEESAVVTEYKSAMTGAAVGIAHDDVDIGAGDGIVEVGTVTSEEQQYRPSDIALAFFAPNLTTDAQGNMTYSFTVPNANTTWALYALAYNEAMLTDLSVAEIISSKPIMVEPNLPRFIRQGDTAQASVLVMNSTDAEQAAEVLFEILNPADMSVAKSFTKSLTLAPSSSEAVDFTITTDATSSNMLVRVKASNSTYTDGVQTLLPVLPASQQVMDSETFYLTPDEMNFSMPLPKSDIADATTIVSFCENPTWEVVSALPGLRAEESSTSLAASAAIFSAAVSGKVLDLNPTVEQGLRQWLDGANGDGALLAMLNRNDDLKQLTLASTPWIDNAESDAERLSRLALLFDRDEIKSAISRNADKLSKLQCADGGWCWTDYYKESSLWVTLEILNNFAELRQLDCFPSQLEPMVKKALKYVDAEVAKVYAKHPAGDFLFYTYVRGLYPEVAMSVGATKAFDATIKSVATAWKKFPTGQKAAAALMLYRAGRKIEAGNVLNSLREFATYNPKLGMWWDSLDGSSIFGLSTTGQTVFILEAFNTVDPGCKEIDRIRQWLILNKVVQDWGTSVNASACVASILQCGSNWLYKPGNVEIAVGGAPIKPTDIDTLTGAFHTAIDHPSGDLTIARGNQGPAWGAVMTRSTQVMTDIKAHSIPELSIQKQMLANVYGQWVDTNEMTVGQTVKVRLIINSLRDMDYVTIVDNRAAMMEPVVQTPRPVYCDGIFFYLENRDAATNLFISHLPKGQYIVEYEMYVNNAGSYSSGVATIQSQYAPEMTAHSSGSLLRSAAR